MNRRSGLGSRQLRLLSGKTTHATQHLPQSSTVTPHAHRLPCPQHIPHYTTYAVPSTNRTPAALPDDTPPHLSCSHGSTDRHLRSILFRLFFPLVLSATASHRPLPVVVEPRAPRERLRETRHEVRPLDGGGERRGDGGDEAEEVVGRGVEDEHGRVEEPRCERLCADLSAHFGHAEGVFERHSCHGEGEREKLDGVLQE